MKPSQFIFSLLFLSFTILSPIMGEEAEEEAYGANYDDDGLGFYNFDDEMDWSDYAIYPMSCIDDSDGDYVVYNMYSSGHNTCNKKRVGIYKTPVQYYVKAYVKQMQREAEQAGADYEVDDEALGFLYCQQFQYNDNYFFVKIGCRENTGKGFQLHTYSDQYCTERTSSQYNMGIDTSSLSVGFERCKNCEQQNQYVNNNNGYYNNYNNYQNGQEQFRHKSPLCGVAWNYKQSCNRSCKRAAKNGSSSSGRFDGTGFSPTGKVFLWILSFTATFFLLASLAQRKRLSKSDAVLEDAAIKSAGIEKSYLPRIIIGYAIFIIFLVLFKRKIFTWFFLILGNIGLLWYWVHLKGRNGEKQSTTSDFQLYDGKNKEMS